MPSNFYIFRAATIGPIALRRECLEALPLPDSDLKPALEDLEGRYQALIDTTWLSYCPVGSPTARRSQSC